MIGAFIIMMGAGIVFPVMVNANCKKKYGKKGWSMILAVVQGALLGWYFIERTTLWSMANILWIFILIGSYGFAIWNCVRRARQFHIGRCDCILAVLAQVTAPVAATVYGVFLLYFMAERIVKKLRQKR